MPLGPVFRNTQTLGALSTVRPLQDNAWIYRVLPFAAIVFMSLEADATGVVYTFSAGSDIQAGPDEPVQSGAPREGVATECDQSGPPREGVATERDQSGPPREAVRE